MEGLQNLTLLKVLVDKCQKNKYSVLSYGEIEQSINEKIKITTEELKEAIKTFCRKEYISVKYLGEEEVCMSVLPRGEIMAENFFSDKDLVVEGKECKRSPFLAAFLGGILGGILATVIFILLGAM